MLRRREFRARGPLPPWWRRPGVVAVVGLLVVGAGLALWEVAGTMLAGRQVREVTLEVRGMALPGELEEWSSACGFYGVRCASSPEPPERAAQQMVDGLRELGHELSEVACGPAARIETGTTFASMTRHDSQCTATVDVNGVSLTVAAWDFLPSSPPGPADGIELGRTAVVVEWDAVGRDRLVATEPRRMEDRFADVRITPEEVAALPGALAGAECVGHDEEGCLGYETELEGPGEGRDLLEAWARELDGAGFLLTAFACQPQSTCSLSAELGRADGELTRIGVSIVVAATDPARASALVHVV